MRLITVIEWMRASGPEQSAKLRLYIHSIDDYIVSVVMFPLERGYVS